jgi:hypothetical protein
MRGDHRPEVVHPAAHGLVRDRDPALRKQILDVTKAEREPEIEPNRLMYNLWREPISGEADFPHTLGYSAYVHPTQATAGVTKPPEVTPAQFATCGEVEHGAIAWPTFAVGWPRPVEASTRFAPIIRPTFGGRRRTDCL